MKGKLICLSCGETVERTGVRQFYCKPCAKIRAKKRKNEWYMKNVYKEKPKVFCHHCGSDYKVWRFKGGKHYCKPHYHEMYNYGEIRELNGRRKKNEYEIKGETVIFYTSKGEKGYIDLDNIHVLEHYYWGANTQGYLHTRIGKKLVRMHHALMGFPIKKVIDHINGNPLDNRLSNLRVCEQQENTWNGSISKNNTTGHSGVELIKSTGKWRARIHVDRKSIHIGHYDIYKEAVKARKRAEKYYFGEYAPTHKRAGGNVGRMEISFFRR